MRSSVVYWLSLPSLFVACVGFGKTKYKLVAFLDLVNQIKVNMAKFVLFTALSAGVLGSFTLRPSTGLRDSDAVVTQAMIDEINAKASWTASDTFVKGMTIGQAKEMVGTIITPLDYPERTWGALGEYLTIPASFDSRTQWPNCVNYIRDQGQCGSCWAFGSSEALQDRFCIQKNVKIQLSPQWLVSCNKLNHGCNGGNLQFVWLYLENSGIPADSCDPYVSGTTKVDESCPSSCADGSSPKVFKAKSVHSYKTPAAIQAAILEGGPIEAAFTVYQDFMSYTGGIYKHTTGSVLGGHAIKIVGWGNQDNTDYWIVANSWGTGWGEQGYFRIAWDQCGISNNGIAGDAA